MYHLTLRYIEPRTTERRLRCWPLNVPPGHRCAVLAVSFSFIFTFVLARLACRSSYEPPERQPCHSAANSPSACQLRCCFEHHRNRPRKPPLPSPTQHTGSIAAAAAAKPASLSPLTLAAAATTSLRRLHCAISPQRRDEPGPCRAPLPPTRPEQHGSSCGQPSPFESLRRDAF